MSEDWARLIYTYRFEKKIGTREFPRAMKPHIDEWNKSHPSNKLQIFSTKAVTKHFNKHVPAEVTMRYRAQSKSNAIQKARVEVQTQATAQATQIIGINKSVKVFDELQTLFTQLKGMYDKYLMTKPELSALSIHLDVIREMRKTLIEIGKMRQSKELIKIAVRSVIDTFLTKLTTDTGVAIDAIRSIIIKKTGNEAFADEICGTLKKTMVDISIDCARAAVIHVKREFALEDEEPNKP